MANRSSLTGACVPPFYDVSLFPQTGGFIDGRLCAPVSLLPGDPTCCLPCPTTNWVYPNSFNTYDKVSEWLNVLGLILMVFLLISYVTLPTQKTRSHYLSICLVISVGMIALGFTIPLIANPEQCYNEITPNDMYSLTECAWSGAFIIAGGLSAVSWIFIRALSMNLQIVWDIVPGRKFFYISQAGGWGIPAILFAATITVTGVSFRFGSACHVNHVDSMADFWGPMLGFAGAAGILQLVTFSYCIHVYLKNLWSDQGDATSTSASGSELPSYTGSVRTQTARAVWRRLKKVLWLQWRGICIVSIILIDVIFFSVVFVYLDGLQQSMLHDFTKIEPWLLCLAEHPTDKDACLKEASWMVNEPTVVAVLLLLALAGLQVFLFLARPSLFPAWVEFIRGKFSPHRQEFVSLDARPEVMRSNSKQELLQYKHVRGHQSTTFEMQKPQLKTLSVDLDSKSGANTVISSPDEAYRSPLQRIGSPQNDDNIQRSVSPRQHGAAGSSFASPPTPAYNYNAVSLTRQPSDYFDQQQQQQQRRAYRREDSSESLGQYGRDVVSPPPRYDRMSPPPGGSGRQDSAERRYQPPYSSFSAPNAPSRQSSIRSVTFADPREIYSRGGLGLNPPSEAEESDEDLTDLAPRDRSFDRR